MIGLCGTDGASQILQTHASWASRRGTWAEVVCVEGKWEGGLSSPPDASLAMYLGCRRSLQRVAWTPGSGGLPPPLRSGISSVLTAASGLACSNLRIQTSPNRLHCAHRVHTWQHSCTGPSAAPHAPPAPPKRARRWRRTASASPSSCPPCACSCACGWAGAAAVLPEAGVPSLQLLLGAGLGGRLQRARGRCRCLARLRGCPAGRGRGLRAAGAGAGTSARSRARLHLARLILVRPQRVQLLLQHLLHGRCCGRHSGSGDGGGRPTAAWARPRRPAGWQPPPRSPPPQPGAAAGWAARAGPAQRRRRPGAAGMANGITPAMLDTAVAAAAAAACACTSKTCSGVCCPAYCTCCRPPAGMNSAMVPGRPTAGGGQRGRCESSTCTVRSGFGGPASRPLHRPHPAATYLRVMGGHHVPAAGLAMGLRGIQALEERFRLCRRVGSRVGPNPRVRRAAPRATRGGGAGRGARGGGGGGGGRAARRRLRPARGGRPAAPAAARPGAAPSCPSCAAGPGRAPAGRRRRRAPRAAAAPRRGGRWGSSAAAPATTAGSAGGTRGCHPSFLLRPAAQ